MLKKLSLAVLLLGFVSFVPGIRRAAAPQVVMAAEPHPHIRAALRELREARHELETAAHDFGGHRKEALEAVDHAIQQLDRALQYDRR